MAAPNQVPIFTLTPRIEVSTHGDISSARDSISPADLFSAGSFGSRIERITVLSKCKHAGTNTSKMIWLCIFDGTDWAILDEQLMSAVTPDATTAGAVVIFDYTSRGGLILSPSAHLGISYNSSSGYAGADDDLYITIEGGDY